MTNLLFWKAFILEICTKLLQVSFSARFIADPKAFGSEKPGSKDDEEYDDGRARGGVVGDQGGETHHHPTTEKKTSPATSEELVVNNGGTRHWLRSTAFYGKG
ncbi:hypothetical protein F2Q69_00055209 [Brassica cretica]|uniref:Uncharacterized protein n=1 Tax=Brassica cretica TaxID=69181 RepID=A0A8S9MYP8_BRACR|nr:hypothetical protein F2Q69_00055209 [Brassica cretica]